MGNRLVLEKDEDVESWEGNGFDLGWSRGNRARTFGHGSVINVLEEVSYSDRMQNVVCEAIPLIDTSTCRTRLISFSVPAL
jgi:hypothetical protein